MEILDNREHGVIAILGMRGTGKTWFSVKLLKHLMEKVDIVYLIDVVGVYEDYLSEQDIDAVIIDIDDLVSAVDFFEFFKKVEHAQDTVKYKIVVYDISALSRKEMVEFMDIFSEYLLRFKPKNKKVAVICDEVGEYAEQERGYYSSGFETLVRIGRNKNVLWIVLITQRPQKVNKHLLALSDIYVIFRLMHNLDMDAVRNILGYSKTDFTIHEQTIKHLATGQYIVYDGMNLVAYNENDEQMQFSDAGVVQKRVYPETLRKEVLQKYDEGVSVKVLSQTYQIPYETIRTWIKTRKKKEVDKNGEDKAK